MADILSGIESRASDVPGLFRIAGDMQFARYDARVRAMHVISGDLWAGAEVQAFTLLTALRSAGVEVMTALMNDGELAARLRSSGIKVQVIDERKLGSWQILRALRRLMAAWQPDVVHTHRQKENVLGSFANALAHRVPCVRTVHGAAEHSSKTRLAGRIARAADRWCGRHLQQAVIAVSRELAMELETQYPPRHVRVIRNGVDVAAIRAQIAPVNFREREPTAVHVGIVGRLVPVKRVDLFLEIAARLRASQPGTRWRFQVIGGGPLADSLAARARELGLREFVEFHGHRTDSIACIAALDALVLCSDHEGLPMTLLEALAVGTPVVAHAVGGMRECLEADGQAGLVFDHAPRAYADAVAALVARGRRNEMIASLPTSEINAQETLALYCELMNKSGHKRAAIPAGRT
jgi:glycosyltransferase involved in cell wall biosynthesis